MKNKQNRIGTIPSILRFMFNFTAEQENTHKTILAERDRLAALLRLADDEQLRLDRDITDLQKQVDTYQHAFETTKVDRNIWQARFESIKKMTAVIIKSYSDLYSHVEPKYKQSLPVYGLPNFFCVGVQKTATSYLYSILREHPLVDAMDKDTGSLKRFVSGGSLEVYREELARESDSPVFMHFDVNAIDYAGSALAIRDRLCRDARILICVRNPIERSLSEWKMRARTIRPSGLFAETLDFISAVESESERALIDPVHHNYTSRSQYAKSIKQYFSVFGRENVQVIVMEEDLGEQTPITLIKLFNFISILDADAINIAIGAHDQHRLASQSPSKVDIEYDGTILKITSDKPNQLNAEVNDPDPGFLSHAKDLDNKQTFKLTDEQTQDLFKRYFEKDVAALEKLLERDLSCWRP